MKYSRTAIGLLTAQYRSVLKKCLLINLGLYALGAVASTPANAVTITGDTNLNNDYPDGVITDGVYSTTVGLNPTVTFTTPTINISTSSDWARGIAAWEGTKMTLGG